MLQLLNLIAKYFREYILNSFLANTVPGTRFLVSLVLSLCIFIDDYIAMGVFTFVIFVLIIGSVETIKENWPILLMPIVAGIVLGLLAWLRPEWMNYMGVSPMLLIWKFFNLCLSAVIFLILLPQRDIVLLVRKLRYPQMWVAIIALFRGVEIGSWAMKTASRTLRAKRVRFLRHPALWLDAFMTGIWGHFLEFIDGFVIALRTRGVESEHFMPRDGIKTVSGVDALTILFCLLGIMVVARW